MPITVDLWQLLGALAGLTATGTGIVWALVKVIVGQQVGAINTRLGAQEQARAEATKHWDAQFSDLADKREEAAARAASLEARVSAVEERLRHIPDTRAMTDLIASNAALAAEVRGLRDLIAPMDRTVDRLSEFLLNRRTP